ncbi:hypothetical protein HN014_15405 [Aquimarina sp. TRL1]|uniref:substrate import-associated zinc metallohydrolase lipoprotein n=1 Tax=Aquimarina sp. (strain TRL1) TaxID=2736252 RepID=UPI00158B0405|nr:substrate import-associated zinc metallohydrolase lipoprotein [Aquimarina sp. TRL1]QKX06237.1 hypothetical protein HN014_15405 [Aquimarina sp. TRL1]
MKTHIMSLQKIVFFVLCVTAILGCTREETIQPVDLFEEIESTDPLDVYLKEEFRDPYGSVIIYKFIDRYIDQRYKAVPPKKEVVKPIAELIKQAWIEPYNQASDQGEAFLKKFFPGEIVILGSPLFNGDGTIVLGTADSGVRVTLTQANNYAPGNNAWIIQTFHTLHHEFAHIIDQNFNFDIEAFYQISGDDYTSNGTWFSITENEAITRGMVTPYGTSAVGEDFAELIATIITTTPEEFDEKYITPENCTGQGQDCLDRNKGRERIKQKYDVVVKYMNEDVGIDLIKLRDEFLKSIN